MAPETAGVVNTAVPPAQSGEGIVIVVAAAGGLPGVTLSVTAGPVPQAFVPLTTIVPVPVPTVVVSVEVLLEPVHPEPVTVQLYDVGLPVAVVVNVALGELMQIVPTAAIDTVGSGVATTVKV